MFKPISSSARFIGMLCHSDGCCPRLFIDGEAPDDACVIIEDDFQNQVAFGIDTVLTTKLSAPASAIPGDVWCLIDYFGDTAYMTCDQHSALMKPEMIAALREEAERRGLLTDDLLLLLAPHSPVTT